jgi:hypothetical protein
MLDVDDQAIAFLRSTYQKKYDYAIAGQKICNDSYDSNVTKAKVMLSI